VAKSPEQALLRGVLDHPDDDAPRLVFADWLEEHGDAARAEFIRVQIDLAILPAGDRRGAALRKREKALLKAHRKEWLKPFDGLIDEGEFRRGFVERVTVFCDQLLTENAGTLFEIAPVRDLEVLPLGDDLDTPVRDLYDEEYVNEEDVGLGFENIDFEALLGNLPGIWRLTRLDLRMHFMTDESVAKLARVKHLSNLRALNLADNEVRGNAMRALMKSPVLGHLEELWLGYWGRAGVSNLDDDALRVLAESPRLGQLTTLGLGGSGLGEAPILRLLGSKHATRLETLDLSENRVGEPVVRALVETPERAARWRHLSLDVNHLNSAAIRPLAQCPHLTALERLDLAHNRIMAVGARALAASPALASLKWLDLVGNPIPAAERQLLKKRFGARVCRFS
jgi:uncharacterized protein (TIGR02996 family)